MSTSRRRHEPCEVLRDQGIPCLVWFEDAIAPYGVPTVIFDLHLLVLSMDEATRALMDKGWTDAGPLKSNYHFLMGSVSQRRLDPPGMMAIKSHWPTPLGPPSKDPPGPTTTVLLPAAYWNVSVDDLRPCSPDGFLPPLAVLIDALIDSFLDSTSGPLQTRLATYVAYVYTHCKSLRIQDFAEQLKLEHRQFHYNALSKPGLGTSTFIEEQRQIRKEIREGKRQPQRNNWYLPPREKEVIHRAPGWDLAFQTLLSYALGKKVHAELSTSDTASSATETIQPKDLDVAHENIARQS